MQPGRTRLWCVKVHRTRPSLTLKSLTVLSVGRRARAGCGQRHGVHRAGVQQGVVGAVEGTHADEPLSAGVGHHRHDEVVTDAGAHRLLLTLHLDGRAADDVLAVGRHHHRVHVVGVPLVDERPVAWYCRMSPLLGPPFHEPSRPTTKCTPSSAATQSTVLPTWKVRSRAPSSVHSFAVRPLTKRLPGNRRPDRSCAP